MSEQRVSCTLGQLPGLLRRDMKRLSKNVVSAIGRTAVQGADVARKAVPVAFGELRDSIAGSGTHDTGDAVVAQTIAAAPHAAAVEIGSAPHKPDFEALVRWVKLRGMQGLQNKRSLTTQRAGHTTFDQAQTIQSMLRAEVQGGKGGHRSAGSYSPVDAAELVAKRISAKIEKQGTKPHWYMRNSIPIIQQLLDKNIKKALEQPTMRVSDKDIISSE